MPNLFGQEQFGFGSTHAPNCQLFLNKTNYIYHNSSENGITCKLPLDLAGRLAKLARRRGVSKSILVREAIEAKVAQESADSGKHPANLIEALGESVGSISSGKRDLARNKKHLRGYGR